jgi:crotonobetaine/carnitine-CoA ligase
MTAKDYSVYASADYPQSFAEMVDWSLKRVKDPEKKNYFRITGQDPVTYAEFARNVDRICNMMTSLGMKKGEHVAIYLPNCVEYSYLYHSLSKCGLVMVPLNQFLRGESLRYIIHHSDAKYLITSKAIFEDKVVDILGQLPNIRHILFTDEAVSHAGLGTSLFGDFKTFGSEFTPKEKVSGSDLQGIWYTSGTTGLPKGVSTTQRSYVFRALFYADYFRMRQEEVVYYILPQYHVAYMVFGGPFAMAAGCEIVQVDWFSASRFWSDINKYDVSVTFSTGTIIPVMLGRPVDDEEKKALSHLRLWVGWPVDDPSVLRARWPSVKFMELYGTTEAGNATICDYDNPQLGTAGPPAPYTDLRIIDAKTGKEMPQGQEGEIKVKHRLGPDYILKEYYKDPAKTAETLKDGYWHSGDVGMIDDKGCLRFKGRIKDYLRVGGENVSAGVVEGTIRKHPAVAETAVVGTKNELGHDELVAHVVLKEGATLDPADFFHFCNKQMSYFMVPRFLAIQKELPKTATLRIEKYKLQQAGTADAIDRKKLGIEIKR